MKSFAATTACALALLCGCASNGGTSALSASETARLQTRAADGDADAAFRLYRYYEYTEHDADAAEVFLRRAAELGSADARRELAYRAEYQKRGSF